jgi:hypothetical protein
MNIDHNAVAVIAVRKVRTRALPIVPAVRVPGHGEIGTEIRSDESRLAT